MVPKAGKNGHVEPWTIGDAATSAGLSQTSLVSAAANLEMASTTAYEVGRS